MMTAAVSGVFSHLLMTPSVPVIVVARPVAGRVHTVTGHPDAKFSAASLGTRSLPCSLCKLFFWWALRLQSSARPPVNFGRNGVLVSLPEPCPL